MEYETNDWCIGCTTREGKQINLPKGWKRGDPLPNNLTVHSTRNEPRRFAFIGDKDGPKGGGRHYFDL